MLNSKLFPRMIPLDLLKREEKVQGEGKKGEISGWLRHDCWGIDAPELSWCHALNKSALIIESQAKRMKPEIAN